LVVDDDLVWLVISPSTRLSWPTRSEPSFVSAVSSRAVDTVTSDVVGWLTVKLRPATAPVNVFVEDVMVIGWPSGPSTPGHSVTCASCAARTVVSDSAVAALVSSVPSAAFVTVPEYTWKAPAAPLVPEESWSW
jgi:hypothetical protein